MKRKLISLCLALCLVLTLLPARAGAAAGDDLQLAMEGHHEACFDAKNA